jgi:rubredoxin
MAEKNWRCDFCGWTGDEPAPEHKCPKCGEAAYMPNYNVNSPYVGCGFGKPWDFPGEVFMLFPER